MSVDKFKNINIVLKISTDDLIAKDLIHVFDDLEASLYRIDREIVEEISREINLEKILLDAALERVRKHRGQRVRINHVRDGSFIFDMVVAGVGLWVLKETVGESIKKGWKDSYLHEKLSKVAKTSFDNMAMRIVTAIQKSGRNLSKNAEIELVMPPDEEEPTIYITQKKSGIKKSDQIPSLSDTIEEINQNK